MGLQGPDLAPKTITHRDEIHGDVSYDPVAVKLLDTAAAQRLGRVYQLGYGHLVYRGGTHTRLSHSMGAYETADRLVDALWQNYERRSGQPKGAVAPKEFLPVPVPAAPVGTSGEAPERLFDAEGLPATVQSEVDASEIADRWTVLRHLVIWAALLHDMGHIPLGHTLEDEFEGIYPKHDDPLSPRLLHLWLRNSDGSTPEFKRILEEESLYPEAFKRLGIVRGEDVWGAVLLICTFKDRIGKTGEFVEELESAAAEPDSGAMPGKLLELNERLNGSLFQPYMSDVVANTISADYLDYLRRDPHNLGLDVLKDDRVVTHFWVGRDDADKLRMGLSLEDRRGKRRRDTCTGVVELVRQRFRFAELVYYNKTKVAASAMLAKVFQLLGSPDEVPGARDVPAPAMIDDLVAGLRGASKAQREKQMVELRSSCLPAALLDPEIGDESLLLFLLNDGWAKFEAAVEAGADDEAKKAMQAITLLAALARRNLYKPAFMMHAEEYKKLASRPGTSDPALEDALTSFMDPLRKEAGAREELERKMIEATDGWPPNSLLLYVPPRKSQAKGIETGALVDSHIETLGEHPLVNKEVKALSQRYSELWRLIVFVHPDHAEDALNLSLALDALIGDQFETEMTDPDVLSGLREACWFPYIPGKDRSAARQFIELEEAAGIRVPNLALLGEFDAIVPERNSTDELATGAALLAELVRKDAGVARERISRYAAADRRLSDDLARHSTVEETRSREGAEDAPPAALARHAAIKALAEELLAE